MQISFKKFERHRDPNNMIFQVHICCSSCNKIHVIAFVDFINRIIEFYPMLFIVKLNKKSLKSPMIDIQQIFHQKKYDILIKCPLCDIYSRFEDIPTNWSFSDGSVKIFDQINSFLLHKPTSLIENNKIDFNEGKDNFKNNKNV